MEYFKFDPETKIWSGSDLKRIYHPDLSIGDMMLTVFARDPNKVVQISDSTGEKFTCAEIRKLSIAVAENLISKGLKQDKDVIGIVSKNTHFLLPIVYGAFIAGIPINSLDPSFNIDDIIHMFGNTRPSIIFCDEASFKNCKQADKKIQLNSIIYILDAINNKDTELKELFSLNKPDAFYTFYNCPKLINGSSQVAVIMCSSGTTGLPKGVCLSHEILIRTATNLRFVTREYVLFSFSTLYWLSGLYFLLISACTASCRIITDKIFSSINALELIQKYEINATFMTPAHIAAIAFDNAIENYDLSSLKVSIIAGSICPIKVAEKMQSYLKNGFVLSGYAMTETAGLGAFGLSRTQPGSVGKIVTGLEMKIIDVNTNESLDPEKEGEIYIRTGMRWNGYYKNEKATKEIYDENGWIHSGDLGYFDKNGFLFVNGRRKEIFKYKNFHVYPDEIESIIMQIPGVQAVSVVGLFNELEAMDYVAAAIVKEKNSKLDATAIHQYLDGKVADFKKIRGGVFFLESLPMTPSGKIIKKKVKELLHSIKSSKL